MSSKLLILKANHKLNLATEVDKNYKRVKKINLHLRYFSEKIASNSLQLKYQK